jgi:hypothetical protein
VTGSSRRPAGMGSAGPLCGLRHGTRARRGVRFALGAGTWILAGVGCASVQIDADGTTRARTLGAVTVETRACAESEPARVCVSITGASASETAAGLVSGLVGFVLGR